MAVVTVIIELGVELLPDIIFVILIGSEANAPTISNSGLWAANPSGFAGNLSTASMNLTNWLNELDNLL